MSVRICEICVTKEKTENYEEAKDCGAGGEGDSSCAHGVFDGNRDDQLHGIRTYILLNR